MTEQPLRKSKPRFADYRRVYKAVRRADHAWWRALRCCNDVRRGAWTPRDVGEVRAQADLIAQAVRRG